MKITFNWLKDFLKTENTPAEIAAAFNRIGHEVEAVEETGSSFDKVVVGDVLETKKHPNADKLKLCTVGVGDDAPRQIVCGAPNVRGGLKVAVALEGAVLPGDFKIKKSKIRGETSLGMICSVKELGLGQDAEGIWEMDTKAEAGTPLNDTLPEGDTIFDLGITPNRGDALSILGLARDLAAGGMGELDKSWADKYTAHAEKGTGKPPLSPEIKTDGCGYFAGISVSGIDNTVKTPDYITTRLEAAGLRPINPAVDISQYVMLTLGQPLHFYDAEKVKGSIAASEAKGGEKLEALDENTYTLRESDLAIADESGVIGLAGIVGGTSTSAEEDSKNIFIEAAQFDRSRIAQTGQALQINSDARYRFERGVDPARTLQAAQVAAALLQEVCGGEISEVAQTGTQLPEPVHFKFNPELVKTFGGLDMPADESRAILEKLGFGVEGDAKESGTLDVTVPYHLTMHETPEDLIEDILRIKGYDHVPSVVPSLNLQPITDAAPEGKVQATARRHLAAKGFYEANTYSFISHKAAKAFGGGDGSLALTNPIDAEGMSHMRPSLLPGLLAEAARNHSRGELHIALGEVGTTFAPDPDKKRGLGHTETLKAAALRMGDAHARNPHAKAQKPDVFTLKADALSLLDALGHDLGRVMIKQQAPDWYHPGRSGTLVVQGRDVGHFGELHPQVLKNAGIKQRACAAELDLSLLAGMKVKPGAFAMSAYQPVRRDFAFVVDADLPADKLITTVKKAEKMLLKDVNLFDVYEGESLPEGKKSLALSVTLQADDHTLSESEIATAAENIVNAAQKHLKAEIRG